MGGNFFNFLKIKLDFREKFEIKVGVMAGEGGDAAGLKHLELSHR